MRRLVITENFGMVTIETSAGVRATGANVPSALQKLDLTGLATLEDFAAVARIFNKIRPIEGHSQIGTGLAGA